ncbi:Cro/CI family transcriptional regulator [Pseudoduganella albidiflava]|uniref:Rha family transcriptional regulator n=1 Tax=Pseudoduganella albidiflava TaxID=321983 RepID=A0A411X355_9BURK|nr:Cro/CI family transcriptional regulator [Pseudoduganella albidiflava]QBI03302.1 Rha family transcriptional regulator [Pseudoduganella albidiflava]GGY67904.1 hypothetical protein GCM10007387_57610 [Pseudoduganella albidiflava]
MDTNLNADQIIDACGGTSAVAKLFEISDAAVSQWRTASGGIPKARLMYLKVVRPEVFLEPISPIQKINS